jgi:hypothetical protein
MTINLSQVGCLVHASAIIPRGTIFRYRDEAHSDRVPSPRAIDGGDLVVRNLMAAVHKLDRASRTRMAVFDRP